MGIVCFFGTEEACIPTHMEFHAMIHVYSYFGVVIWLQVEQVKGFKNEKIIFDGYKKPLASLDG